LVTLKKSKRILILEGGISDEYEISKLTAKQVFETIQSMGDVEVLEVTSNSNNFFSELKKRKPDIVFNCLHGFFGEDGQVQSILNYLKIPYTHSGVLASAISMNKIISKKLFISNGIRTPDFFDTKIINKINLPFPIILKPVNGGSSNGLMKLDKKSQLKSILNKKKNVKNLLIEEFIEGRELTVGILEDKVCGIMEIKFKEEVYDYNNKYVNIAHHILNPKLPKKIKDELVEYSLKAHSILNCNCISRVDYRYDEKNQKIYLLEVNTQPGLTKNSLLPEMAKSVGISFFKLCKILIENSICEN
tara:strand:+ start:1665 stop:2576 length:912 start_codon:yes stop_codon:yes gene_type:complete